MVRTKKTPKPKDLRLVRDSLIHAKATAVLGSLSKAHQLYGSVCKEREVNGRVVSVCQKETNTGRMMNYVTGRYQVGPRLHLKELPLSSVFVGESVKFPLTKERTDSLGGQRTIATFVTPTPTRKPPPNVSAPIARVAVAPPTQLSQESVTSSDDDVPLIQLLRGDKKLPNKKPAANPPPAATQEATILASDDDATDDEVKPAAIPPTPNNATAAAATTPPSPVMNEREPLEVQVEHLTWTESVPVHLLNGGHVHRNWHHKTSTTGVRVEAGSDRDGLLPYRYYFETAFPMDYLPTIVKLTNEELGAAYLPPTDKEEIMKFFGILLLIPHLPRMPRKELWSPKPRTKFSVAPSLGLTGMSRDRFEHLFTYVRFSDRPKSKPRTMANETYAWKLVEDFVDAVNEHKASHVYPGSIICIDESIVRWYGIGGEYLKEGCPHYVMMNSKPDFGMELQTSACAQSGVMLQMKLVRSTSETKRVNLVNKVPKTENAGTTAVKQLTSPWHGTNRVAVGDSAFASVATAMEMKELGLGFVGCVKTATKLFPHKTLKEVPLPGGRGDFFGMMTLDQGVELLAFTWCDRNRRSFISTAGSLAKADEQERFRYRPIGNNEEGHVWLAVDIPLAAEMYYAGNGAIDFHNRVRSQDVHIDRSIGTKKWDVRMNLGILSMLFTDAWLLYRAARGDRLDITASAFFEMMAADMIDPDEGVTTRLAAATPRDTPRAKAEAKKKQKRQPDHYIHRPTKRRRHGKPNQLKQNNCVECKKSRTYVCHLCSLNSKNEIFVCKPMPNRNCWAAHLKSHH